MKILILALLAVAALTLAATLFVGGSAGPASKSLNERYRVTVYSSEKIVGAFISTEQPFKFGGDGFYFHEELTHKLIEVSGTVVIEQLQ